MMFALIIRVLRSTILQKRIVQKASSVLDGKDETEALSETFSDSNPDFGEGEPPVTERQREHGGIKNQEKERDYNTTQKSTVQLVPRFHRKEIKVGRLLGTGGFSQVYEVQGVSVADTFLSDEECLYEEAREKFVIAATETQVGEKEDQDVHAKFVIKHVKRKLLRRPKQFYQAAMDLDREAYLMTRLNHPHILQVRAVTLGGTSAFSKTGRFDSFFIVMDRLRDNLEERIQKWHSSPVYQNMHDLPKMVMKTRYAYQISQALSFLHDQRIIYRDLKPTNMGFLPNAPDHLQLFDFGLSRTLPPSNKIASRRDTEEETFLMTTAGTTRYMATEVTKGRYNLKADVYSFAMVCYEMYAEKKPFPTLRLESFYQVVYAMEKRPNVSHLDLPKALESVITGSWCRSLENRLSMEDICEVLPLILVEMELEAQTEVEC